MPYRGMHSGPKVALEARNPDKPTQNKLKTKTHKQTSKRAFQPSSSLRNLIILRHILNAVPSGNLIFLLLSVSLSEVAGGRRQSYIYRLLSPAKKSLALDEGRARMRKGRHFQREQT